MISYKELKLFIIISLWSNVKTKGKCTWDFCTPEHGYCVLNEFNEPSCVCYDEYYTGDRCQEPRDVPCFYEPFWIPLCKLSFNCVFSHFSVVSYCPLPKTRSWGSNGYDALPPFLNSNMPLQFKGGASLFKLEPYVLTMFHVDTGFNEVLENEWVHIVVDDVPFLRVLSNFYKLPENVLPNTAAQNRGAELKAGYPLVRQRTFWTSADCFLRYFGYTQLVRSEQFRVLDEVIQFSHPIQKLEGIDGQFNVTKQHVFLYENFHQYNAKRRPEDCVPQIKATGGACEDTFSRAHPQNKYTLLKIHSHKRPICNQSHILSKYVAKDIHFRYDDKDLNNIFTKFENLEAESYDVTKPFRLFDRVPKNELVHGSLRMFMIQTREEFDEKMYKNSTIKYFPKSTIRVCYIKYSENQPKAIPVNEFQGIHFRFAARTYIQFRPSYKLTNFMCEDRLRETPNDVEENIAEIFEDFLDLGPVDNAHVERRKHIPAAGNISTIQMVVSRYLEEFYNESKAFFCPNTTVYLDRGYGLFYDGDCVDQFCPKLKLNKEHYREKYGRNESRFAYYFYTSNFGNLGNVNESRRNLYDGIHEGYELYGNPAIIYAQNTIKCKFIFSYYNTIMSKWVNRKTKHGKFTSSTEYPITYIVDPFVSDTLTKFYPTIYFKCIYNCGWGHGNGGSQLVFSDFYDMVVFGYGTFNSYYHSIEGEFTHKRKLEYKKNLKKKVTPIKSVKWVVNDDPTPRFINYYNDPLNPYAIFREFEFLKDFKARKSTRVNFKIFINDLPMKWAEYEVNFYSRPLIPNFSDFTNDCVVMWDTAPMYTYLKGFLKRGGDLTPFCSGCPRPSDVTTVMFYQKLGEFPADPPYRGVMLAYTNGIRADNTLLTYSPIRNHLIDHLVESTFKCFDFCPNHADWWDSLRPAATVKQGPIAHSLWLMNICFDGLLDGTSVKDDIEYKNVFRAAQKIHMFVIELSHLAFTAFIEDNIQIINTKQTIKSAFTEMAHVETDLLFDAFQWYSLLYEIAYIEVKSIETHLLREYVVLFTKIVHMLPKLLYHSHEYIYNTKPGQVSHIVGELLRIYTAFVRPGDVGQSRIVFEDVGSLRVQGITVDQLEANDEGLYENYPFYDFVKEEWVSKINEYNNITNQIHIALPVVLNLMDRVYKVRWRENLDYKYRAKIFMPMQKLNLPSTFTPYSALFYFDGPINQLQKHNSLRVYQKVVIDIYDIVNRTGFTQINDTNFLTTKILVVPVNPYWYAESSIRSNIANIMIIAYSHVLGYTYRVIPEKKYKEHGKIAYKCPKYTRIEPKPLPEESPEAFIQLGFVFYLGAVEKWKGGIAIQAADYRDLNAMLSQIVIVPPDGPNYVFILFKDDLPAVVNVIIAEHTDNATIGREAVRVGPGVNMTLSVMFRLKMDAPRDNETVVHIIVYPDEDESLPFRFHVFGMGCYHWASDAESPQWNDASNEMCQSPELHHDMQDSPFVEFQPPNIAFLCPCMSNSQLKYSYALVHYETLLSGFLAVEIDFQMKNMMLVPFATGLMLLVFFGCLAYANLLDSKDKEKWVPIYLLTNRPDEEYKYFIVVQTGCDSGAGTTSNVGIKLYGTMDNSKRHVLRSAFDLKILKRRQVDWFCLTTSEPLGNIRAIELWIDNRGPSPSWKCEKVIVRDYNILLEWVFMVQKWFSLILDDMAVHRITYQRICPPPTKFEMLFRKEDFYIHHMWYGMFVREHCHAFSRKAKVLTIFSIFFLQSCVGLCQCGLDAVFRNLPVDEGDFHTDWALSIGITSLLLSLLVNYPIMYIIKNSNTDPNFRYQFSDFSGINPTGPIPLYMFEYSAQAGAQVIQGVLIFCCSAGQIYFGLSYGIRKSYIWLMAVVFALILDLVFAETINVIVRAIVVRFIMKIPDTLRFCNELVNLYVENQIPYANRINKKSLLKQDMLQPMPKRVKNLLRIKEQNFKAFGPSIKDFFFWLVLFLNNCLLFAYFHPLGVTYFATDVMHNILIDKVFTGTRGFLHDVNNYNDLFEYLNMTLLFGTQWQKYNFMVSSNYKLLGTVRLRQLRIIAGRDWAQPPELFGTAVIDRCEREFRIGDLAKVHYNPFWKKFNKSLEIQTFRHRAPFMYNTAEELESSPRKVGYLYLPGSGYVATLGRTPENTRATLNYLVQSQWFSNQTRYIFIEIAAYNIHANFFNKVTLVVDISHSGDMVKEYAINTFRGFEPNFWKALFQLFLFIFMGLQSFNIIVRHIHQVKYCLWRGQAFQDTLILFLTVSTLMLYALRFIESKRIISKIGMQPLNMFISMDHFLVLEYLSNLSTGLLCSQNLIHLIDIFHSVPQIRIYYFMLMYAMDYILVNVVLTIIFFMSFSFAMHFISGQENELFSTLILSYIQTFGIPFVSEIGLEFHYGTLVALMPYIMFTMYGYTYRFLICNMFAVVLVNAYHRARVRLFKSNFKFGLWLYVRERILGHKIIFDDDRLVRKKAKDRAKDDQKNRLEQLAQNREIRAAKQKAKEK